MKLTVEQILQQGIAAHKEGKLQEAENLYRTILQTQPTNPYANHNLGVLAVSMNKPEVALPFLESALEVNPNIEQFWISYIDALIKVNQFDIGRQALEKAKKAGFDGEKLNALEVLLIRKIQEQASETLVPPQTEINSMLANFQRGQHEIARDLALSITKKFPDYPLSWKVLGAVCEQARQMEDALIANQIAVRLDPEDAESHSNLGNVHNRLDKFEEAEASYKQAIKLKPDYTEARYNLGTMLEGLGRLEEAEKCYRQAININKDFNEAIGRLGFVLMKNGKHKEGLKNLRLASGSIFFNVKTGLCVKREI
jgi:tetratricopeptide (TPR) repeat protein